MNLVQTTYENELGKAMEELGIEKFTYYVAKNMLFKYGAIYKKGNKGHLILTATKKERSFLIGKNKNARKFTLKKKLISLKIDQKNMLFRVEKSDNM